MRSCYHRQRGYLSICLQTLTSKRLVQLLLQCTKDLYAHQICGLRATNSEDLWARNDLHAALATLTTTWCWLPYSGLYEYMFSRESVCVCVGLVCVSVLCMCECLVYVCMCG